MRVGCCCRICQVVLNKRQQETCMSRRRNTSLCCCFCLASEAKTRRQNPNMDCGMNPQWIIRARRLIWKNQREIINVQIALKLFCSMSAGETFLVFVSESND